MNVSEKKINQFSSFLIKLEANENCIDSFIKKKKLESNKIIINTKKKEIIYLILSKK